MTDHCLKKTGLGACVCQILLLLLSSSSNQDHSTHFVFLNFVWENHVLSVVGKKGENLKHPAIEGETRVEKQIGESNV